MKNLSGAVIFIIFHMAVAVSCNSHNTYYEVWRLNSLEKIGGHSVQVFGNPQIVNTEKGAAIKFDGVDDRILVHKNPIGDAKEFTVEVIFKPDTGFSISREPRFIHIQDPNDTSAKRVMIELRVTQNNEWYLDGYMLTDAAELPLSDRNLTHPINEWAHAAVTYKEGVFKTFVNGKEELKGNVRFIENLINQNGMVSIGGRMDNRNYYLGLIKTLKITRKALNPDEFTIVNFND
jgi:hypothetical protein